MSVWPEITLSQIVARLRMIVAEPDSLCKTDLHYIGDAADELESRGDEIARLTAERDEMQRELRKAETESSMLRVECGVIAKERDEARRSLCECLACGACDSKMGEWFDDDGRHLLARDAAKERGWDCFEENGK